MLPTSLAVDLLNRQILAAQTVEAPAAIARETAYFRDNIGSIETPEELLEDFRLYRYVMTAYDLEGALDAKAIVQRVLEEGADDSDDLAVRLSDPKYQELTEDFAFNVAGNVKLLLPSFQDEVIERYQRVQLEIEAGESNNGARLSSYFDRKIQDITTWYQVLADPPLRDVMFTALQLPDELQGADVDDLVERFEEAIPLADFQDDTKRKDFLDRFATMNDLQENEFGAGSGAVQLLTAAAATFDFSL